MKHQKNRIIAKISLLSLIVVQISPAYGMMSRLRLGLQKSTQIAGLACKPIIVSATPRAFSTKNPLNFKLTEGQKDLLFMTKIGLPIVLSSTFVSAVVLITIKKIQSMIKDYTFNHEKLSDQEKINEYQGYGLANKLFHNSDIPITYDENFLDTMIDNESEESICNFFIKNPSLFSEQQQEKILKKYIFKIFSSKAFSFRFFGRNNINYINIIASNYILNQKDYALKVSFFKKWPRVFTEEQQIKIITDHLDLIISSPCDCFQHLTPGAQDFLHTIAIEHKSKEVVEYILFQLPYLFSKEEKEKIIHKLNAEYGIFENDAKLTEGKTNGPLFSNYLSKNIENYVNLFPAKNQKPHFFHLLPYISEYTKKEYQKDHIVLFHGQKSIWVLLEMIYNTLVNVKNNTQPSDNFKHLRFKENSTISIFKKWIIGNFGSCYTAGLKNNNNDAILFTNLHPAANNKGSNSWHYAVSNHDLSGSEEYFYLGMIEKIFNNLNMTEQYAEIQKNNPRFFTDLYTAFSKCVKEQGNHGNLIAISMPKNLAVQLVYSTHGNGSPMPLTIEKNDKTTITTTNVITLSENFNSIPLHNAYALILDNRIINKEAAQKAGVTIRYFNTFEDTEDYLKIVKMFQEKIASTKK